MNMLYAGKNIVDIKNRLGHENIQSTMTYLHLDLRQKKDVQSAFDRYTKSLLDQDDKINDLLDWQNKEKILDFLDSL